LPPPVAVAPLVAPPVAYAPGSPGPAPSLAFDDTPGVVATPLRGKARRRKGGRGWLAGLFIFLLLAGGAAAGIYFLRDYLPLGDDEERSAFKTKGNFGISLPAGWRQDNALREKLQANLVASRKKPRAHLALFYRDFRTRALSDAELLDVALNKLKAVFPRVEYLNPFQGPSNGRDAELDGEPAVVFTFSATDPSQVPMTGQCYMLARQGYAYWLLVWGPEEFQDQLPEHFEVVRQRFKLFNEREGWKATPPETERFVSREVVHYQLDFIKEVWEKEPNPKDADPEAELYLRGFEPTLDDKTGRSRVDRYSGKAAEVQVLVLPKAANLKAAHEAARAHFEKKLKDPYPGVKIEALPDSKTGKVVPSEEVGAFAGQVTPLRVALDAENEKFALLAVTNREQGSLVIWGECRFDRRFYWEQEFRDLLKKVRPVLKE